MNQSVAMNYHYGSYFSCYCTCLIIIQQVPHVCIVVAEPKAQVTVLLPSQDSTNFSFKLMLRWNNLAEPTVKTSYVMSRQYWWDCYGKTHVLRIVVAMFLCFMNHEFGFVTL